MMLSICATVFLLHVWSYDFYYTSFSTTVTSYDKFGYKKEGFFLNKCLDPAKKTNQGSFAIVVERERYRLIAELHKAYINIWGIFGERKFRLVTE